VDKATGAQPRAVELLHKLYEAGPYAGGDLDTIRRDVLAPDVVWTIPGRHPLSGPKRGVDEIMIIGGSDVFAAMMPRAARLEITHVHARPEGDVLFPPIDPAMWREVSREEVKAGPDDSADFAVAVYERR